MSFREIAAFFIRDQCLFGAYPTQHQIHELEEWGVDLIVNLTNKHEKNIRTYSTSVKTINFIISDNKVPENIIEFCALIIHITKLIDQNQKIYIHCKGGHGRSGVLVASILCYKYRIMPHEAIQLTTKYHSTRPIHARRPKMNEYWKSKGSPQTKEQKQFVVSIFHPYVITKESPFNQRGIWLRNTSMPSVGCKSYQDSIWTLQGYESYERCLTLLDIIALEDGRSTLLDSATGPIIYPESYSLGGPQRTCTWDQQIGGASPNSITNELSFNDLIDSFLISTKLGPITGNNGNELEKYRDSLIENLVYFP